MIGHGAHRQCHLPISKGKGKGKGGFKGKAKGFAGGGWQPPYSAPSEGSSKGSQKGGKASSSPGGGGKGGKGGTFDGTCHHCGKYGHRKNECRFLDAELAKQRGLNNVDENGDAIEEERGVSMRAPLPAERKTCGGWAPPTR